MFDILDEKKKLQYTNLMEELKDLHYQVTYVKKRSQMGIRASIRRRLQMIGKGHDKEIVDRIPPRNCMETNYFCKERVAIYTCIIGNYDELHEPVFVPDNCDFYVITDIEVPADSHWQRITVDNIEGAQGIGGAKEINRWCKMNPHKIFKDYQYTIYVDGNYRIITDLTEYINRISEYGISFFAHGARNCVYDEIQVCIDYKKADPVALREYEKFLEEEKMPKDYGLLLGAFIARNHKIEACNIISEKWWETFQKFPLRDQIVLPYVLYKENITPQALATLGGSYKGSYAFERCRHTG